MAVRILVYGVVQGVFFRAATQRIALELGLHGWVKNVEDGSVSLFAEGSQEALEALQRWVSVGPTGARVHKWSVSTVPNEGYESFTIES